MAGCPLRAAVSRQQGPAYDPKVLVVGSVSHAVSSPQTRKKHKAGFPYLIVSPNLSAFSEKPNEPE